MRILNKSIFFVLAFAYCCALSGQTRSSTTITNTSSKVTVKGQFLISFYDTTYTLKADLEFTYDSDKGYCVQLAEGNDHEDSIVVLGNSLNFGVFEHEFNRIGKKVLGFPAAAKTEDVNEIFRVLWNINHPDANTPEAGKLQFNQQIMVFKGVKKGRIKGLDEKTLERKKTVDNMVSNKMIDASTNHMASKEKLENYAQNILRFKKGNETRIFLDEFFREKNNLKADSLYDKKINTFINNDLVKLSTRYRRFRDSIATDAHIADVLRKSYITSLETKIKLSLVGIRAVTQDSIKIILSKCDDFMDADDLYEALAGFGISLADTEKPSLETKFDSYVESRENLESSRQHALKYLISSMDSIGAKCEPKEFFSSELLKSDLTSWEKIKQAYTGILKKEYDVKTFKKLFLEYTIAQKQLGKIQAELEEKNIYKINMVEMQFEHGFLERVKVWVAMDNSEYIFENIYAIGFSSTQNYRDLAETKLFVRNSKEDDAPFIVLSDVFRNYDNRLDNFTRDYSPADTTFKVKPDTAYEITLRKDSYINLFDAKIFSDLKGTARDNPNGLFQIEISRRFNINTSRYQVGNYRADYGYFNYLDVWGSVNKIEQNNRELILRNANVYSNGTLVSPNYATNLDFIRYENYSAGCNLNLLVFDKPDQKYTIYGNFGVKYGHVAIKDSVLTPTGLIERPFDYGEDAHTISIKFPITLELLAEKRINLKFSYSPVYSMLFSNNQFKQVVSYTKSNTSTLYIENQARWANQFEAFIKIAPSFDRKTHFFLRFRFYSQRGDANTSFSQFQLGYTYNWSITR